MGEVDVVDAMMAKFAADVERRGWSQCWVGADFDGDENDTSAFAYTLGFTQTYGQPDLVMVGFGPNDSHTVFSLLAEKAAAGEQLEARSRPEGVLQPGHAPWLLEVNPETAEMFCTKRLYGSWDFRALQVVLPALDDSFPWEAGYPDGSQQKVLGRTPDQWLDKGRDFEDSDWSNHRPGRARAEMMREMRIDGRTLEDVGKEFGISGGRVGQILEATFGHTYVKEARARAGFFDSYPRPRPYRRFGRLIV